MKKSEFIYYLKYEYKGGVKADRPLGPNTARSIMHRAGRVERAVNRSLDDILDGHRQSYDNALKKYHNELQDISNHPPTYICPTALS